MIIDCWSALQTIRLGRRLTASPLPDYRRRRLRPAILLLGAYASTHKAFKNKGKRPEYMNVCTVYAPQNNCNELSHTGTWQYETIRASNKSLKIIQKEGFFMRKETEKDLREARGCIRCRIKVGGISLPSTIRQKKG